MSTLTRSDCVVVSGRTAAEMYTMVSDVTRTGEWSPICTGCWWDEGDAAKVGAHFTGHNELPDRVWETRCEVVVADPGRAFAWIVGESFVRWDYTFEDVDGGARVCESWEFLPAGIAMFHRKYAADAEAEIEARSEAARTGIPVTLRAIKAIAEV